MSARRKKARKTLEGGTRERLVEAAFQILEEAGYAGATVQAIADRAGVSAGALYRHFPSKAEMFVEVFRDAAKRDLIEFAGRKEIAMLVPLIFLILPVTVAFALFPGYLVLQAGF